MNEHEINVPLCSVDFTRSSTKDGGAGYRINVSAGCEAREAQRIYDLALSLKVQADDALKPKSLEAQLEESLR